jgi:hypothetical protein
MSFYYHLGKFRINNSISISHPKLERDIYLPLIIPGFEIKEILKDTSLANLYKLMQKAHKEGIEDKYHLASLDPGSGKSSVVQAYLREWKRLRFQPFGSSTLICLSTFDELDSYIERCGLDYNDFAVFCGNPVYNSKGLGAAKANEAKILFTTQQMVTSRTRNKSFSAATEFQFNGKPRSLRIWDESLLPATPICIRFDDIDMLASPLRPSCPNLIEALEALFPKNERIKGGTVAVPWDLHSLGKAVQRDKLTQHHATIIDQLQLLAGSTILIDNVGGHGLAMIGRSSRLPEDMAPAIVLDASIRVRSHYRIWEEHGGKLTRLPAKIHDYSNMAIRWWQKACGKEEIQNAASRDKILEQAAKCINTKSDKPWLVIHFKDKHLSPGNGFVEQLSKRLVNPATVKFVHWGKHHGTNEFQSIVNVMVVGILSTPSGYYKGISMAASGLPVDHSEHCRWNEIGAGERQHALLQAICRSNVRNVVDGVAGKANVYLIASSHIVSEALLEDTFPGCTVNDWRPIEKELKGHAKATYDAVYQRLIVEGKPYIAKQEISNLLAITPKTFSGVTGHAGLIAALGNHGIAIEHKVFRGPSQA